MNSYLPPEGEGTYPGRLDDKFFEPPCIGNNYIAKRKIYEYYSNFATALCTPNRPQWNKQRRRVRTYVKVGVQYSIRGLEKSVKAILGP